MSPGNPRCRHLPFRRCPLPLVLLPILTGESSLSVAPRLSFDEGLVGVFPGILSLSRTLSPDRLWLVFWCREVGCCLLLGQSAVFECGSVEVVHRHL